VQPTTGPRAARVYLTHIDPWSVMKQAFLLSMALAVVLLVAVATLWFALDSADVLDAITRTATDVGGESAASLTSFLDFGRVMGVALVVAGIETVLLTALATLFAFLYNLAVGIGGGLEITLSEDDL
jgi:ABC-type sugar transport system permease subunit